MVLVEEVEGARCCGVNLAEETGLFRRYASSSVPSLRATVIVQDEAYIPNVVQ